MNDPVLSLAVPQIIEISAELENELTTKKGPRPLLFLLQRMREEASEALADLAYVEPENAAKIRSKQDIIRRFSDTVEYLRAIWTAGLEESAIVSEHSRQELSELVGTEPQGNPEANEKDPQPSED